MTARAIVLVVAAVIVVIGAGVVFWRDLRIGLENRDGWMGHPLRPPRPGGEPSRRRLVVEAALAPLLAVALVWWAWAVL